ncbi:MAG: hypothetical protein GX096_10005 [Clostridiales bacterium]|nr:hypothetical protein [Clostridiales bacterium]
MNFKKFLSYILGAAVLMMTVLPMSAFAESAEIDKELEGFVTEVVENGFLMNDRDIGSVMVNTGDTTVYDGLVSEGTIEVGQYLIVSFSGRLTRSLPPQAYADRVVSFKIEGTVDTLFDGKFLLTGDGQWGDVIVHMGVDSPNVYSGVPITVYFDGIMAMSMPGQVSARAIVVPQIRGTVSEKNDEGFIVTDADGESYQVLFGNDTIASEHFFLVSASEEEMNAATDAAGADLIEDEADAKATEAPADAALEAEEDSEAKENSEAADIPDATGNYVPTQEDVEAGLIAIQPAIEINDGDMVTVYYNGVTTRSIPAQLTAIEIVVYRD